MAKRIRYARTNSVRARIVRSMAKATKGGRGRIKNRPAYKKRVR